MSSPEEYSAMWANNPEPMKNDIDPQVILDCNMDGKAFLYNSKNNKTEWLSFNGETIDLEP